MTKIKATLATLLMALTMAIGIGGAATPAYAATCANYPPGQIYKAWAAPSVIRTHPGGFISLYARATHGGGACSGAKMLLSFRYGNSTIWRCCLTNYTDSSGLVRRVVGVSRTFQFHYFRYYWRFGYPGGSVISGYGLVYVS